GTRRDRAAVDCLHQLFEQRVRRSPEALAVSFDGVDFSYRELNRRANALGRRLRDAGVGRDDAVGICLERSLDMVVAVLAILKAGGAYVPLDPAYPPDRLGLMLEDAQVRVLPTGERLQGRFASPSP